MRLAPMTRFRRKEFTRRSRTALGRAQPSPPVCGAATAGSANINSRWRRDFTNTLKAEISFMAWNGAGQRPLFGHGARQERPHYRRPPGRPPVEAIPRLGDREGRGHGTADGVAAGEPAAVRAGAP